MLATLRSYITGGVLLALLIGGGFLYWRHTSLLATVTELQIQSAALREANKRLVQDLETIRQETEKLNSDINKIREDAEAEEQEIDGTDIDADAQADREAATKKLNDAFNKLFSDLEAASR